ncbi:MAG: DUF2341 domain-containing protein [Burkholderiales bacterium]
MMNRLMCALLALACLVPSLAAAWWNPDWTSRRKVTLDTSAKGAGLVEPLSQVPVLIRLHTGNFPFAEADVDGKDLRFVAEDDRTPLKFHVEKFDAANELALIWVQVPKLVPGNAEQHVWLYFGNDKAPAGGDARGTYDAGHTLVLHFGEADGRFQDSTAYAHGVSAAGAKPGAAGVADGAVALDGTGRLSFGMAPALKQSSAGLTFSAWVKFADPDQTAMLYGVEGAAAGAQLQYVRGRLQARVSGVDLPPADLAAGGWHHVALSVGERAVLFVDGKAVADAAAKAGDVAGDVVVAAGFRGELDELQLANVARGAGWIAAAAASQGEAASLVRVSAESESDGGEGASYFRILLGAVTLDGWVVIAILMVMMVVSVAVMISKSVLLARTDGANRVFQARFAESGDLLAAEGDAKARRHSTLFRVHETAVRELRKRVDPERGAVAVSAKAIDAIRASLDATVVRENAKLNNRMVLLTIAISGGPFLGLLGTVVGVMITFAAIAAVGDVNVNSIAPGIAAALVATVAGLGVAIPALFGYNYLASRIKNISADMQVFTDELVSRIAEQYAD